MDLIESARQYALKAHQGQKRKYSDIPYFKHPERIALKIKDLEGSETMQAAAYLHDVIEDCQVTYQMLEDRFGRSTAQLVWELTNDQNEIKQMGKKEYLLHKVQHMSDQALTIKLCDFYDNLISAKKTDQPEFFNRVKANYYYVISRLQRKFNPHQQLIYQQIIIFFQQNK